MRVSLIIFCALGLGVAACGSEGDSLLDDGEGAVTRVSEAASGVSDSGTEAMLPGANLRATIDDADLSTTYSAMDLVGFDDLERSQTFTFFAPNDAAFAALDADRLAELMADPAGLGDLLRDHVIGETLLIGDLVDGPVESVGGLELDIDSSGPVPTVNGIEIVKTDLLVGTGVVHVIDGVLLGESE